MCALGAVLAACGTAPRAEPGAIPLDFALAITVFAPARALRNPETPPGSRPARYVMEADWVLRSNVTPDPSPEDFPPATRVLPREEVRALWDALRESGLLDPAPEVVVASPALYRPPARRTTWLVGYGAEGRRRAVAITEGTPEAAAAAALADRVARLAFER